MKNLVIIGAGGFAREVFDLANYCYGSDNTFGIKGFLSDNPSNVLEMGYPKVLSNVADYEIEPDDVFFCGIGNLRHRKRCVEIIRSKGGTFINLIHPSAVISPSVKLGAGVAIKAFCVLASDVIIGDFTFLQSSVVMGHDVKIGNYCQINSFSFFAGNCIINDSVLIGASSSLVQNVVVEEGATVGMGSVVLRKVKKDTTVFGNPAKAIAVI